MESDFGFTSPSRFPLCDIVTLGASVGGVDRIAVFGIDWDHGRSFCNNPISQARQDNRLDASARCGLLLLAPAPDSPDQFGTNR